MRTDAPIHPEQLPYRTALSILASNTAWTAGHQILDKVFRFVTVPILIHHFGRSDFGLLGVVAGITAYSQIAALGIPTGLVKHASQWLQNGQLGEVHRCARSALSFYLVVGVFNAFAFMSIAFWSTELFALVPEQQAPFRAMLFMAAIFAVVQWSTLVTSQLLSAAERIAFIMRLSVVGSILELLLVIATVWLDLGLVTFFTARLLLPIYKLPFLVLAWKAHGRVSDILVPGWFWADFRPVFVYGVNLLSIALFQLTFMELRPVILGMRAQSLGDVTDYSIVYSIGSIVIIAQSWLIGPLVPMMAKAIARNDTTLIHFLLYRLTKLYWLGMAFLIGLIAVNSADILRLYMGHDYTYLTAWVSVYALAFSTTYIAPFSSYLLAQGRLRPLMLFTATSVCLSLAYLWHFAPTMGFRAAVIATVIYYFTQMIFYHVYHMPHVMAVNPLEVLRRCYLPITSAAVGVFGLTHILVSMFQLEHFQALAVKSLVATSLYGVVSFKCLLDPQDIQLARRAFASLSARL